MPPTQSVAVGVPAGDDDGAAVEVEVERSSVVVVLPMLDVLAGIVDWLGSLMKLKE